MVVGRGHMSRSFQQEVLLLSVLLGLHQFANYWARLAPFYELQFCDHATRLLSPDINIDIGSDKSLIFVKLLNTQLLNTQHENQKPAQTHHQQNQKDSFCFQLNKR